MRFRKIVLIIPPSPWLISDRDIPMLGILYLSSYLKKYYEVEVEVCDLSGLSEPDWYIPIGDIYGVTGTSPHFIYMKRIIDILKDREPDKPVIVGGVHASVLPDHVLHNTRANACVVGAGEIPLSNIIRGESWENIGGLATRSSCISLHCDEVDLDGLPTPDRKAIDYYSYLVPRTFGYMADVKREGSIITGRGCPHSCSFCASHKLYGGKVRLHSPQYVANEVFEMRDSFGVEMINILDDTFILNKARVASICDLIKGSGVNWFCLTRVDTIDEDLLVCMKDAGCLSLAIGFETGSNRLLKLMNKRATVEQGRSALTIIAK